MPNLTIQLSPSGPLVEVSVGVSVPRRDALTKAGQAVPANVPARLLIDTGAGSTCLDPSVISALGLSPTGTIPIHTPSTCGVPHVCNQYDVLLIIIHPRLHKTWGAIPIIESQNLLATQGIHGLLGRDILAECHFIYNGEARFYTLCF